MHSGFLCFYFKSQDFWASSVLEGSLKSFGEMTMINLQQADGLLNKTSDSVINSVHAAICYILLVSLFGCLSTEPSLRGRQQSAKQHPGWVFYVVWDIGICSGSHQRIPFLSQGGEPQRPRWWDVTQVANMSFLAQKTTSVLCHKG